MGYVSLQEGNRGIFQLKPRQVSSEVEGKGLKFFNLSRQVEPQKGGG